MDDDGPIGVDLAYVLSFLLCTPRLFLCSLYSVCSDVTPLAGLTPFPTLGYHPSLASN